MAELPSAENDAGRHECPASRAIGDICPHCLLKPCECPVDESTMQAFLASVTPPESGDTNDTEAR